MIGSKTKFAAVSLTSGANLPSVSTTPVVPVANLPPLSFLPVVHLDLRKSPRIFEKIRNDPYVIFRGLEEDDS
jgi:hypothetical protein